MIRKTDVGLLGKGGIFSSSDEFDTAVRRHNQDVKKLLKLAKRNSTKIHHICLLQAREHERVSRLNKDKTRRDRVKPNTLCTGVWVAL